MKKEINRTFEIAITRWLILQIVNFFIENYNSKIQYKKGNKSSRGESNESSRILNTGVN